MLADGTNPWTGLKLKGNDMTRSVKFGCFLTNYPSLPTLQLKRNLKYEIHPSFSYLIVIFCRDMILVSCDVYSGKNIGGAEEVGRRDLETGSEKAEED